MTRLEKNKTKKNYHKHLMAATVSVIMFIVCLVLAIIVTYKGFKTDIIFGAFVFFYMISGLVFLTLAINCENDLNQYRRNLRANRHKNLLRIGVEAVVNKDRQKAINIQKMMTIGDYRIFLKGFILSADKMSGDDHIVAIADSNLKDLY